MDKQISNKHKSESESTPKITPSYLFFAIKKNDIEQVKELVNAGVDVHWHVAGNKFTALQYALAGKADRRRVSIQQVNCLRKRSVKKLSNNSSYKK
jgi:hypothetical protein